MAVLPGPATLGAGGVPALGAWRAERGLDGSHQAPHLHRSVLEGIVMTMHGHVAALSSALALPAGRLVLSGGGSRSALMCQIAADVFARPVERAAVADAAGLGAAICAAVGRGTHPGFEAAVAAMVRPGRQVLPEADAVRRYADLVPAYTQVTSYTDPLFRHLAR